MRDDVVNWPVKVPELAKELKPDHIVVRNRMSSLGIELAGLRVVDIDACFGKHPQRGQVNGLDLIFAELFNRLIGIYPLAPGTVERFDCR